MVTEFGMSKLEPMSVKLASDSRATRVGPELSNEIDTEWLRIVDECYAKAKEIILKHERQIERLAQALLIEQTLLGARIIELWEQDGVRDRLPVASEEPESIVAALTETALGEHCSKKP